MKLSAASLALLPILASSVDAAFAPPRFSFEEFANGKSNGQMMEAFEDIGMISITNIPQLFDKSKLETLKALARCMDESFSSDSSLVLELQFPDGTRRRTMAAHSKGTAVNKDNSVEVADHQACVEFKEWSQSFRETVGLVVDRLSENLAQGLHLDDPSYKPLLVNTAREGYSLTDVFSQGDHLEHFHCYDKNGDGNNDNKATSATKEQTIEWHTDQGLALIFTPGVINGQPTEGFYIQLADGSTEMVDFQEEDDLVIMLGDGVNQYVNQALGPEQRPLRALPHSLQMPTTSTSSTSSPRVWYGRMVLPPAEAVHPVHSSQTFGEIRESMLQEDSGVYTSIGCSKNLVARELDDITCEEGLASFCWHRCMNYTDYDVSPAACEAQSLDLACINEERFLWARDHNPDFAIGCVNLTEAEVYVIPEDDGEGDGHDHGDGDGHDTDSSAQGLVVPLALASSAAFAALLF
jgi:hypothetical protein